MKSWIPLAIAMVLGCDDDPTSTPLPCDVQQVIQDGCIQCHRDPPQFGAPISLLDWEDTQATAPTAGVPVYEAIVDRIRDAASPMPPLGLPPLTADQIAVFDDWVAAGAPPGEESDCANSQ